MEQYDQGIDYELSCYTELTLKVYEGYICVDVKQLDRCSNVP